MSIADCYAREIYFNLRAFSTGFSRMGQNPNNFREGRTQLKLVQLVFFTGVEDGHK